MFLVAAAAFALLILPAVAAAANHTVEVGQGGNRFVDDESHTTTTTIHVGDTVTWTWDSSTHSTTSGNCCTGDGTWDSGVHSAPFNFSHTFNAAGSFPYFCVVHGAMMTGTVVVQQAGSAPTANFSFAPANPVMGNAVQFTDTSTGSPTSWSWNFGDPASGNNNTSAVQNPTHAFAAAGSYNVSLQATNASGSNTIQKSVTVSAGGPIPCVADAETLCLNNGRFQVTTEWTKPDTTSGHGNAISLTGDSGYFWFFDASNIEAIVKVLNGCGLNNAYWVFAAGLTNVQVDLKVIDTQTGIVYDKQNPQGTAFQPIQDTSAFPTSCP
ncbi:MAG: PKD domain-containing protein [Syntrophomonadaceae bacterium]